MSANEPKQTFRAFQTISQSTSDKPVDQMTDAEITVRIQGIAASVIITSKTRHEKPF